MSCTTYQLKWTISTACSSSESTVNIAFNPTPTIANAGSNQTITTTATSTTLAANTPSVGTGQWSIVSGTGGSFANAANPNTTFTGQSCTSYPLKWTVSTPCNSSESTVDIAFNNTPTTADAGSYQCIPDGITITTLEANAPTTGHGVGVWSVVSGTGGSFGDINNPSTSFSGLVNTTYVLKWTISTSCSSSSDTVYIQFTNMICPE